VLSRLFTKVPGPKNPRPCSGTTAQMASVVYHEYGHGINDRFYEENGSPDGMINGATHEGMADVVAALIEDWPEQGRGFFGPGTFVNNLDNTNRYPDDISGEVHNDGLIISGAFWDLRLNTDLVTAQYLHHYAMYGLPDDPNNGIAFSEWFIEVLVADDDDGNISNGTPNFAAINDAFNQHSIGTNFFMLSSFTHTQLEDTDDTLNAFQVDFHIESFGFTGGDPDSLFVHYTVDNFQTLVDVEATDLGSGDYQADIPAQPAGSFVRYYITVLDPLGDVTLWFPANNGTYDFLVGFKQIFFDDLEDNAGYDTLWTVNPDGDDDATGGIWELADPFPVHVSFGNFSQPGDDHTPSPGVLCFVTGSLVADGQPGFNDIDNGKTTLLSPVYDLSILEDPVYCYYKWYSNDLGPNPGTDFWVVEISNDGGQNWVTVENTNVSTGSSWQKIQLLVSDFVTPTDNVQLRFIASDLDEPSLVEALIDDIEILAVEGPTAIDDEDLISALPTKFELSQNYPNPFNPTTNIKYSVANFDYVKLAVYNLIGEEVKVLVNGQLNPGFYEIEFDAAYLPSGVYFYQLKAGSFVETKKMVLLR